MDIILYYFTLRTNKCEGRVQCIFFSFMIFMNKPVIRDKTKPENLVIHIVENNMAARWITGSIWMIFQWCLHFARSMNIGQNIYSLKYPAKMYIASKKGQQVYPMIKVLFTTIVNMFRNWNITTRHAWNKKKAKFNQMKYLTGPNQ